MVDEGIETEGQVESKEEDVQPVTNPAAVAVQIEVKEAIKGKQETGAIRTRVVDALVEEEVENRAALLTKALAKRKAQQKELDKFEPDQCTYNANGSPANEHWSKAKLKEKQGAEKGLDKIDKAINQAINEANYDGVRRIAQ